MAKPTRASSIATQLTTSSADILKKKALSDLITQAPNPSDHPELFDSYDAQVNYAARLIYEYLTAHDHSSSSPATKKSVAQIRQSYAPEPHYKHPIEPIPVVLDIGLYEHMVRDMSPINELGLTGQQWQYAYTAAVTLLAIQPAS